MAWYDALRFLGNAFLPGNPLGTSGRTPGFNPNAPMPGTGQAPAPDIFNSQNPAQRQTSEATSGQSGWEKLLPWLQTGGGIAANVIGGVQANNAMNQSNEAIQRMQQQLIAQAEEEKARRAQLSRMAMPALFRDMGYDPGQVSQRLGSGPINLGPQQQAPQQVQQPTVGGQQQLPSWFDPNNAIHRAALKNRSF